MPSSEERLRFAVYFAQIDLDRLRPGDWLNLRDDLAAYLGVSQEEPEPAPAGAFAGHLLTMPSKAPHPRDFSEDNFRSLQAEVNRVFQDLMADKALTVGEGIDHQVFEIHVGYTLAALDVFGLPGQQALVATGAVRDLFLLVLFNLLGQEQTNRLLRCPECGTIFYRTYRQAFCSRACVNRANIRKYRSTATGKEKDRNRKKEAYRKKVRSGLGRVVKEGKQP